MVNCGFVLVLCVRCLFSSFFPHMLSVDGCNFRNHAILVWVRSGKPAFLRRTSGVLSGLARNGPPEVREEIHILSLPFFSKQDVV